MRRTRSERLNTGLTSTPTAAKTSAGMPMSARYRRPTCAAASAASSPGLGSASVTVAAATTVGSVPTTGVHVQTGGRVEGHDRLGPGVGPVHEGRCRTPRGAGEAVPEDPVEHQLTSRDLGQRLGRPDGDSHPSERAELMARRPGVGGRRVGGQDHRASPPHVQPARGRHGTATVAAGPGEDEDPAPDYVAAEGVPGNDGESPAGVLHHLQERDGPLVDHDPVDLGHLGGCDGRYRTGRGRHARPRSRTGAGSVFRGGHHTG